jgi:hypothetical protein
MRRAFSGRGIPVGAAVAKEDGRERRHGDDANKNYNEPIRHGMELLQR